MKFFFDRNACVRTSRMLAIFEGINGHLVRHHNDDHRFHKRSADTEILKTLHDEDPEWIFVGSDGNILRNKAELAVLTEVNLTYLIFNKSWGTKPIEDTCWMLIKGWPKIIAEVERLKIHSILEVKYGSIGATEIKGSTASFRFKSS